MAIINILPNNNPMTYGGHACTTTSTLITIPTPEPESEFCICEYVCEFTEKAFHFESNPDDERRNDFYPLLINLSSNSSTFEFKLKDTVTGVEYDLNDNTYGVFFDIGSLPSQPLKAGYKVDWLKVKQIIGNGTYRVLATVNNYGTEVSFESHKFLVCPFNETRANDTVKIVTENQGIIVGGEDYDGISWTRSVRINGRFGLKTPNVEVSTQETELRKLTQIQDKVLKEYTLETELLPSEITNMLMYNDMLANEIKIYDYQLFANEIYNGILVRLESADVEYFEQNPNSKYEITFKDVDNTPVKRNKFI